MDEVRVEADGPVVVVTIDRPKRRNAVDSKTAEALVDAFTGFDTDENLSIAVLTGAGGTFCAGFDLKALSEGDANRLEADGDGPMGPTRMQLSKPVIGAVEGYAVAGGMELALWCDLRVAARDATFGIFNRRFGVPLIDLGTVRLPRIVGHARAMDLILTGRAVGADEAQHIGLVNRIVDPGTALDSAVDLAKELCAFPQRALRNDRLSVLEQWGLSWHDSIRNEFSRGLDTIASGEAAAGAERFASGEGRHGSA